MKMSYALRKRLQTVENLCDCARHLMEDGKFFDAKRDLEQAIEHLNSMGIWEKGAL